MTYVTVDNALNRERVLGILEAFANEFSKLPYDESHRMAKAYSELRKMFESEAQYQLKVRVEKNAEVEELKARIERAEDRLKEAFRTPRYVDTPEFNSVEDALWMLAGEPDGAE